MEWKIFSVTKDGITLNVRWWAKGYTITCNIEGIELKEMRCMMYMIPKVFTEEMLREKSEDFFDVFKEAYKIIMDKKEWFDEKREYFANLKNEQNAAIEKLNEKKRELKNQLKAGTLDAKEYQKRVGPLNVEKREVSFGTNKMLWKLTREIVGTEYNTEAVIHNYLEDLWNEG